MFFKIKAYGEKITLKPRLELYSVEDFMGTELPGLAICLDEVDEDGNPTEQYTVLTVSFGEFIGMKNVAYIDTNNNRWAHDELLEKRPDIIMNTGFTKRSGFCEYPLWAFAEDFLKEIGPENYKIYSDAYDAYMRSFMGGDEDEEEEKEGEE